MSRHPWACDRRRDKRGTAWTALAEQFQQAEAPRQAAQDRAGEAQPQAGADAPAATQRTAGPKR